MNYNEIRRQNIEEILKSLEDFKSKHENNNLRILFFCDGYKNEVKAFITITNYYSFTEQITYTKTYSMPFDDISICRETLKSIFEDSEEYLRIRCI